MGDFSVMRLAALGLLLFAFCAVAYASYAASDAPELILSRDPHLRTRLTHVDGDQTVYVGFLPADNHRINLVRVCTCAPGSDRSNYTTYDPSDPDNTGCSSPGTAVAFTRVLVADPLGGKKKDDEPAGIPLRLHNLNSDFCPVFAEIHFDAVAERSVHTSVAEARMIVTCPHGFTWDGIACYPAPLLSSFWFWVIAISLILIVACVAFYFCAGRQQVAVRPAPKVHYRRTTK